MIHPEECFHGESKDSQVVTKINYHIAHFKCWILSLVCSDFLDVPWCFVGRAQMMSHGTGSQPNRLSHHQLCYFYPYE